MELKMWAGWFRSVRSVREIVSPASPLASGGLLAILGVSWFVDALIFA